MRTASKQIITDRHDPFVWVVIFFCKREGGIIFFKKF